MAKRKRPEQLTPVIRWNAYARDYEKALIAFARELTKSVGYHALAALKRTDAVTLDAADGSVQEFKIALRGAFRKWDEKASELGPKLADRQLKRLFDYVGGKYKPLLGKAAGAKFSARAK